jgi:hypothetical protein
VTLEPGSDLSEYGEADTTYLLKLGAYNATSRIDARGSGVVCYVGLGTAREDVVIKPIFTQVSSSILHKPWA